MDDRRAIRTVEQVFVPGGRPTVTYVPRDRLRLEEAVDTYLREGAAILSVSGPTKTGKTVLLRNRVSDAVWLSGGVLESVDDFWNAIADGLGVFTSVAESSADSEGGSETAGGSGTLAVVSGKYERTETVGRTVSSSKMRDRSARSAAREALASGSETLVIDDFHYITPAVQGKIVRGLKDLIFDGLRVIVAAVPHRAYDVVRVEKEMTGRVTQLPVGFWDADDLEAIAIRGFDELGVRDPSQLRLRLVEESFGSPHLMQEFCRELCKANGVTQTVSEPLDLQEPVWEQFFRSRASSASKTAFDLLARGPRQRSDRKIRTLKDGTETDIYGLVLRAIATTGPRTQLTYEQLRGAVRLIIESEPPQRHEITRVLEEMASIAQDKIDGEPVVDYDEELGTLHIADPYFAYFLRWGEHTAPAEVASDHE